MKKMVDGTTRSFPSERALVLDIVRAAQNVPTFGVEKWFELDELAAVRLRTKKRISWAVLFIKALGIAGRKVAELRQCYLPYPWPRLHQATFSVISLSINRHIEGCDRLFWGRFPRPEARRLNEVQYQLDRYRNEDPNKIFKRQVLYARLPGVLRRAGLWWRLYASPTQRARRLGTASVSTLSSFGVLNRTHPNFLTASLDYGPLQDDGRMWVTLRCDHRVMDGVTAARALNAMQTAMQEQLLSELTNMCRSGKRAA